MSPNWQSSPTAMPQGLLRCNQSFWISTEHPKENMTRPTITADATVKTSFRLPWPSGPTGRSPSMLLAGQVELLGPSALISSRESDSGSPRNSGSQHGAGLSRCVSQHCNRGARGSSGSRQSDQAVNERHRKGSALRLETQQGAGKHSFRFCSPYAECSSAQNETNTETNTVKSQDWPMLTTSHRVLGKQARCQGGDFSKPSRDFKQPGCGVVQAKRLRGTKTAVMEPRPTMFHKSEARPVWKTSKKLEIISGDFQLAFSFPSSVISLRICV